MSIANPGVAQPRPERSHDGQAPRQPASTETKASFKTTELFVYIGLLAAIFVAGAVTKAGSNHGDVFPATRVWLYATILTVGYLISRGLAKAGSRDPYLKDR
jgi:hypothetical protein